jgi:hypothetical protein
MDTFVIVGMLLAAVFAFLYMLCGFLLGRYLAAHHQKVWLKLGKPGGLASGRGSNTLLGEWLRRGGFRHLDDPTLLKWCPFVNKLRSWSVVLLWTTVVALFLLLVWKKLK